MKFKYLYFLTTALVICVYINKHVSQVSKIQKQPVNTGIKYLINDISIQIDTIIITDENIKNFGIMASGVFLPYSGTIIIKHFETKSLRPVTQNFCTTNNSQTNLILRHELEHARKANITKNIDKCPDIIRAKIAIMNEIIAPTAEIIEALDYKFETKSSFITNRLFINKADKLITTVANNQKLTWPLDFGNQQIADILIQCATEHVTKEINRGMYKKTISNAFNNRCSKNIYVTNNLCNKANNISFNPYINIWDPMWQFETKNGNVNIWGACSKTQQQNLIRTIDSLVHKITGKTY